MNILGLLNKSSVLASQRKLVKNLVNSYKDGRQLISAGGGGDRYNLVLRTPLLGGPGWLWLFLTRQNKQRNVFLEYVSKMSDKEPIMQGKRTGRVLIFGGKKLSLGETQTQSV